MKNFLFFFLFFSIFVITSCANTKEQKKVPEMGSKGGVCYSTLTCNSGLICIDMVCVEDPCYDVVCDSWKMCVEGICKLKPNRCDAYEDCRDDKSICDSNHYCVSETNPCDGIDCNGHGKCFIDSETKDAVCNCDEGYNNNRDKLSCVENEVTDPCENVQCEAWEQCNSNTGNCDVIPGMCGNDRDCFGGKICTDHNCLDPVNPCEGVTCSNHGTCVIDPNTELVSCNCDINDGYFPDGLNCINPCLGHENCEGYGECKPTSAHEATCECIEGYIAQGLRCVEHDLCANSDCAEWKPCDPDTGACVLSLGRCDNDNDCSDNQVCDENHSCINQASPCEGQDCSGHGVCVIDVNGNAACNCDVNNGYYPSGLNCLNPCENQDCSNHGTCIPSNATTAICNCDDGYTAVGMSCIENDPCDGVSCPNSWEECRDGSCQLIDGMCEDAGDCPTVKPACVNNTCVNLCDNLNCGAHGQCVSDATDAVCVCEEGYEGDLCDTCAQGYQDNDNNSTCEPYLMWCKLQAPATINQDKDTQGELVFGRVYVEGITETTTQASPVIKAQLGYTPYDVTNPVVEGNFFWVDAEYNPSCANCEANNDEYMVRFPTDMAGDFKYIYRFSTDNGNTWLYCDLNGSGGINNDPFEPEQVGVATINGVAQNPVTDLFISEYIEGATGNNKALEIYNGTDNAIDLSNYQVWKISNGGNWFESKLQLSGTLNPGDVYVICHRDEDLFPDVCDLKEYMISAFNGDDAIGLAKKDDNGDFQLIDAVGTDGGKPDEGWDVAGVAKATKDHVLRRKPTVFQGNTDWDSSRGTNETDSEWIVLDDDFSNLGSFTPAP